MHCLPAKVNSEVTEKVLNSEKSIVLEQAKNRLVAQSKLMQLHFFSDALVKNSNSPEFWTDLLYLSLKVGDRFAPHGKLA